MTLLAKMAGGSTQRMGRIGLNFVSADASKFSRIGRKRCGAGLESAITIPWQLRVRAKDSKCYPTVNANFLP
jgi:hypothetical protein